MTKLFEAVELTDVNGRLVKVDVDDAIHQIGLALARYCDGASVTRNGYRIELTINCEDRANWSCACGSNAHDSDEHYPGRL